MKVVIRKASDSEYLKFTVIKSLKGLEDFIKENGPIVLRKYDNFYFDWEEIEKIKSKNFEPEYEIKIYDDYIE